MVEHGRLLKKKWLKERYNGLATFPSEEESHDHKGHGNDLDGDGTDERVDGVFGEGRQLNCLRDHEAKRHDDNDRAEGKQPNCDDVAEAMRGLENGEIVLIPLDARHQGRVGFETREIRLSVLRQVRKVVWDVELDLSNGSPPVSWLASFRLWRY